MVGLSLENAHFYKTLKKLLITNLSLEHEYKLVSLRVINLPYHLSPAPALTFS